MSNTQPRFATPIYTAQLEGSEVEQVQLDFKRAFDDLTEKDVWKPVDEWQTCLFSDPGFNNNLLEDYKIKSFQLALDTHIRTYLSQIGFWMHPKMSYRVAASWMTLTHRGGYGHIHSHGVSDISGVYYFATNEEDGDIFFESPNKLLSASYCFNHMHSRMYFKPKVGRLILFPGWLEHGTQTNKTDHGRVSVSFNIHFRK
jgi:uncharacterized protein (TIGR02466 family)